MWENTPVLRIGLWFLAVFTVVSTFFTSLFPGNIDADLSQVTQEDFESIKTVYKQMLLGSDEIDVTDSNIKSKINGMVSLGRSCQASLIKDGSVPWVGGTTIEASTYITNIYYNIFYMTIAYSQKHGSAYLDPALLSDILYALDWMHDNYYGENSTEFTKFGNWWDWDIGAPTRLINILMLLEDHIDGELVDKYIYPVNYYVPKLERTSANLVDSAYIVVGAGALQDDAPKLYKARQKLDKVFKYVNALEGFYEDGSYVMHYNIAYQGSYGTIMLDTLSKIILSLEGTFFEISSENKAVQTAWAFDSYIPLMYKGTLPGMVRGRDICRNKDDITAGFSGAVGMLRMTKYIDTESAEKLSRIVKYFYTENASRYASSADIYDLCLFYELMHDDTIEAESNSGITKLFPKMSRLSKLTDDYSVGISMSSFRTAKYEAINGENGKGWYTGDGMLYINLTALDFNQDYWHNVNYYRMPGTTVTTRERKEKNVIINYVPKNLFAGGVALDGCAVTGMQLLGSNPDFNSSLKAKKAWFVFDDEIVALGADINCSDDFSVETVVENRKMPSGSLFSVDGNTVDYSEGNLVNPKQMFIEGLGGIYLPDTIDLNFEKTDADIDFIELWIDHGLKPKQATYSYVVLPAKTETEVGFYADNPDVEIFANNSRLQAVRENKIGFTGYLFWGKDSFDNISVNKPCAVIKRENENGFTVSVSDPTQIRSSITVKIDGADCNLIQADNNISCINSDDSVILYIDLHDRSGLGSTAVFNYK